MTKTESQKLEVGARVMFSDGVAGIVTEVGNLGVRIMWEDGQKGVIVHEDMQDVSLLA